MKFVLPIVLYLFLPISIKAQNEIKINLNQRVILNYPDHVVYAEVLTTDNDFIKPSDDLYYYWFSANDIKITRGGFDGKLLHGVCTEFYLNKNLKEKGKFRYGLKNGEWKSWFINGEYKEISNWKKGKKQGRFKLYDESGQLTQEGNYKNSCLNGKVINYDKVGGKTVCKYKHGILKEKKSKKNIFSKGKKESKKESKKDKKKRSEKSSEKKQKKKDSKNKEKE